MQDGPPSKTRDQLHRDEIAFFESYYGSQAYNARGWRLRLRRELKSLLHCAETRRLGRVLSLGCGDGQFELMLAPYADRVIGLDLSPQAIAVAQRAASAAGVSHVEFQCGALESFQWPNDFDIIVCLATLHHVPPAQVPGKLQQIHEHLAPGGMFYSQDPNRRGILRAVGRIVLGNKYHSYHSPDERELDPAELAEQLKAAGFRDVRIGYIDLTLIPGLFILARGPSWPMYPMLWLDWLWRHTPLARWSSGFTACGRRQSQCTRAGGAFLDPPRRII